MTSPLPLLHRFCNFRRLTNYLLITVFILNALSCKAAPQPEGQKKFGNDADYFIGLRLLQEGNENAAREKFKRCIKKGAIERTEPGFLCHALLPKAAVQEAETDKLINKIYDGSADKLFAALLGRKKLSAEQLERLRQIVGELE